VRRRGRLPGGVARVATCLAVAIVGTLLAPRLGAQPRRGNVALVGPPGDSLRSVTPTFSVLATNFLIGGPLRVTLQIDTTSRFTGVRDLDVAITTSDSNPTLAPTRALPEAARVYFRAIVSDPSGVEDTSATVGPKFSALWIATVAPPNVIGQPVNTRRPRFVWRSPQVNEPPGPWSYTLTVTNLGQSAVTPVGSDTSFVPPNDLLPNAIYTWTVEASLRNGQRKRIAGTSFVIEDPAIPVASTLLYQNFPNPFPSLINAGTCIWFDLKKPSVVSLDVLDLRGLHVRRLLPNNNLNGLLPAGRYGRGRVEENEGCDRRVEWDGTDDNGAVVPEGVYIIRFRGDGEVQYRKALFHGRR
jgi:hypothetical protein